MLKENAFNLKKSVTGLGTKDLRLLTEFSVLIRDTKRFVSNVFAVCLVGSSVTTSFGIAILC